MKEWREDAQPEWPDIASATWRTPAAGGGTQTFPETGALAGAGALPEAENNRGGRAARTGADETAVLPRSRTGADETAVLPPFRAGGRPADFRRAAEFRRAVVPDAAERTAVLPPTPAGDPVGAFPASTRVPRDPWDESAPAAATAPAPAQATDPTHDPHEVTVQLDAVQLGDIQLSPAAGAPGGPGRDDGPVFVDASGRRSRTFRRLGMVVGVACAVFAVVIVATLLSGSSDAPWIPVPQHEDKPAGQVDTSPAPAGSSVQPSGTGDAAPGATPTTSGGTTPAPGSSAEAPGSGTAAGTGERSGSADPRPTATRSTSRSGGGGPSPDNAPSTTPADSTGTSPSGPIDISILPTEPAASGGGTGAGSAADGQAAPPPVVLVGKPLPGGPSLVPSPEHTL
ncbi:hypothetical protein [Streptomyces collinus]|uniref:hypothetical protein n=1 Tax=Streptomyces collinus TaxID=42684 RepID=UPI0033DE06C7